MSQNTPPDGESQPQHGGKELADLRAKLGLLKMMGERDHRKGFEQERDGLRVCLASAMPFLSPSQVGAVQRVLADASSVVDWPPAAMGSGGDRGSQLADHLRSNLRKKRRPFGPIVPRGSRTGHKTAALPDRQRVKPGSSGDSEALPDTLDARITSLHGSAADALGAIADGGRRGKIWLLGYPAGKPTVAVTAPGIEEFRDTVGPRGYELLEGVESGEPLAGNGPAMTRFRNQKIKKWEQDHHIELLGPDGELLVRPETVKRNGLRNRSVSDGFVYMK